MGAALFASSLLWFVCAGDVAAAPAEDAPWAGSRQCYCTKTALGVNETGVWRVLIDKRGVVTATGEMAQQVRRFGAGAGPDTPYDVYVGHYTATGTVTRAGVIHLDANSKDAQYYPNIPLAFDGAYDPETKSFHGHYYYGANSDPKTLGTWY